MQKSWMWKLAGLGVVTVSLAATAAGCSDDDPTLTPQDDPQQCGDTVVSMNGQACKTDGRACTVPIVCTSGEKQVSTCRCDGKTFSCTGTDGQPVTEGEPTCQTIPSSDPPNCEGSADQLNGTGCDTLRRSCRFKSAETCTGEITGGFDTCDCRQVGGDNSLKWVCSKTTCGDGGTFVPNTDGGSSSGGNTDAGHTDGGDAGDDL